jgi:uncharacterized protein YndB with AHSA1/START domain
VKNARTAPLSLLSPALALLVAVACAPMVAQAQSNAPAPRPVEATSWVAADGTRTLRHSAAIRGAPGEVWDAFTTTAGYASWAAPVARVDFRLGGEFETSYATNAAIGAPGNIRNEIVAYLPRRMFALRNRQVPPDVPFDARAFQSLHTVVTFDDLGGGYTRVSVEMPGLKNDPAHEAIAKFFDWGNAATLAALRDRFDKGPTDWKRASR